MSLLQGLTLAGGAITVLTFLGALGTWIWKGSGKAHRWDRMETVAGQIKDAVRTELAHVNATMGRELAHIADEIMLLRESRNEQGELLARTVTMVYELEKRMDRWDRPRTAP